MRLPSPESIGIWSSLTGVSSRATRPVVPSQPWTCRAGQPRRCILLVKLHPTVGLSYRRDAAFDPSREPRRERFGSGTRPATPTRALLCQGRQPHRCILLVKWHPTIGLALFLDSAFDPNREPRRGALLLTDAARDTVAGFPWPGTTTPPLHSICSTASENGVVMLPSSGVRSGP